jgi:hypothetical protein
MEAAKEFSLSFSGKKFCVTPSMNGNSFGKEEMFESFEKVTFDWQILI